MESIKVFLVFNTTAKPNDNRNAKLHSQPPQLYFFFKAFYTWGTRQLVSIIVLKKTKPRLNLSQQDYWKDLIVYFKPIIQHRIPQCNQPIICILGGNSTSPSPSTCRPLLVIVATALRKNDNPPIPCQHVDQPHWSVSSSDNSPIWPRTWLPLPAIQVEFNEK